MNFNYNKTDAMFKKQFNIRTAIIVIKQIINVFEYCIKQPGKQAVCSQTTLKSTFRLLLLDI